MSNGFRLDVNGNLRSELLEQIPGLAHGFGTRTAGLPPSPMATVKQIHSAEVLESDGLGGLVGEGDALVSQTPGEMVGVKTADCVPILLADPVNGVVAAVHAGWRGTAQEIAGRALRRMQENYKTNPIDVYAAIGPAIGSCCYEVGGEVARKFGRWDESLTATESPAHLNLAAVNFSQLALAGLRHDRIALADACTKCRVDLFYSYRQEGDRAGRMISWIGFEPSLAK